MKRKHGFTLVELLVVIGIISLLISILLPSLARARDAATTVSCAANLRQIGQALMLYAEGNKGKLPYGITPSWSGDFTWTLAITQVLGGDIGPDGAWRTSAVLRDPGAVIPSITTGFWEPVAHYGNHPRLMPSALPDDVDPANGGAVAPLRTLSSVRDSSSKALAWDATQLTQDWHDGTVFNDPVQLDGMGWYGHSFLYPPRDGSSPDGQVATGRDNRVWGGTDAQQNAQNKAYNHDSAQNTDSYIRFRHQGESTANILFCDGHVEGRRIGDVPRLMFLVNK